MLKRLEHFESKINKYMFQKKIAATKFVELFSKGDSLFIYLALCDQIRLYCMKYSTFMHTRNEREKSSDSVTFL